MCEAFLSEYEKIFLLHGVQVIVNFLKIEYLSKTKYFR